MEFRLSKINYYFDFVIYPIIVLGLIFFENFNFSLFLAEILIWTLFEYSMHRWIFHSPRFPYIRKMHMAHHSEPEATIGVSSLGTSLAYMTYASILFFIFGESMFPFLTGFLAGYCWYIYYHAIGHHHIFKLGSHWVSHEAHHSFAATSNFGVTTDLWDRVFNSMKETHV